MPRNANPKRSQPGPFIIVDGEGIPVRDANGNIREFSTVARATPYLRPGDKAVLGTR
jgi:hypothetical protein